MNLNKGDVILIDGVMMEVDSSNSLGYWLREIPGHYHINIQYKSRDQVAELFKAGRATFQNSNPIIPGSTPCTYHVWAKYVGVRDVYNYCEHCGAKQHRNWREIKDEKEY